MNQKHDALLRSFEDLRYRCEDLENALAKSNAEEDFLRNEIVSWKEVCEALNDENRELKQTIEDIENKNKKLGEVMNSAIFNQAADYKQKALNSLKGFSGNESDNRLYDILQSDKVDTNKGLENIGNMTKMAKNTHKEPNEVKSNYQILKDLDNAEN